MAVSAATLSAASLVVVVLGAGQEPYFGIIRKADALVQVGFGSVLIALWAVWCVATAWLVRARLLHPMLLGVILWALVCAFYLGFGVNAYLDDIIRFQSGTYPGGPVWPPPAPARAPAVPTSRAAP
jgi:hypothetical protein